jgi:signal transduction histidine kinase/ligand-binding sensor domain-containing protein
MNRIIAGFVSCLLTGFCFGQSFTTINYSVAEGLPSSEVYEVYQDREGFLWFATDNGVVRFDGSEMQKFGVAHGLTDPVVFGLFEDSKGRIWFRTFSGRLSYYEKGEIKEYAYNDQITNIKSAGAVNFVYDADTGDLWFTLDNIAGRIDSTGNARLEVWKKGVYCDDIKGNYLIGLAQKGKGPVRSVMINGKSFPVKATDDVNGTRSSYAIRWNDKLYISIKKDIFEFDGTSVKKVFTGPSLIISLSKDKGNNLWAGYLHHGVQRYQSPDFRDPWAPEFLAKRSVTKVLEDNEQGLWFTTLEQGVFYVPNLQIQNFQLQTKGKVRAVMPAGESFLVADEAGLAYVYDSLHRTLLQKRNFNYAILCLFTDRNKNIWLSTTESIYIFDQSLREKRKIINNAIEFSQDKEGYVWGYGSHSIKKFDSTFTKVFNAGLNLHYRSLYVDDSLVFLGTRIGLHIRNRNMDLIDPPDIFSNLKISRFFEINDTTLLVTTMGNGFILLNKKNWHYRHFSTSSNFIADNVYTALKHGDMLWFATDRGIVQTDVQSLLGGDPAFDRLTRKSGLVSDKVNFLIFWNHAVWAFSDEGFSRIPRSLSRFANEKPDFYLKNILVNDKPVDMRKDKDLDHDQNNISIAFGYKSFNNQDIFTRYKLKDDHTWKYITHNTLQFTSLAPGTYDFELQYSADNIHWEQAPGLPAFIIHPPLWETWYFQTFVALLVLSIIYWYFRDQVNIYRRHQQKLIQSEIETIEKERSRIAKDLHDSVGTDFTAIKMVVNQILKKYNEPQTDEVEVQFQNTIQDVKSIIYGLSPPGLERYGLIAGLRNYVGKLNGKIPLNIEVNSFGPEVKDPKLSITVFRIIQELISNSLKHSNAKTISLHINSFADLLNIVYEDNGKGFAPEEHNKGLGLFNIESRIQSVNGQLRFDSGTFGISYTIDIPLPKVPDSTETE